MTTLFQSRAQLRIMTPELEELLPLPWPVFIRKRVGRGVDGD
jgi:hypothetical protein